MVANHSKFLCIEQLHQSVLNAGFDALYIQTNPGHIDIRLSELQLHESSILREQINVGVEYYGAAPDNFLTFIFLDSGPEFFVNGCNPGEHRLYLAPPGAEIHCVTGGMVDVMTLSVPLPLFHRYLNDNRGIGRIMSRGTLVPLNISSEDQGDLAACIRSSLNEDLSSSLLHDIDHLLLETLSHILAQNSPDSMSPRFGKVNHRKAFNRARHYILDNLSDRITSADLVEHVGMTERSLERLFRKETGITPRQYIKVHRLNSARRQLTQAGVGSMPVHVAAMDNGFMHMGRFSQEFRDHFGVLPSELSFS